MLSVEDAPEDAGPAAGAPLRRRFRLPKALLVTVLGLALSAWLIPAMTRQWDDRQREHELKAGVVASMATATAQALVGGEAVWSRRPLTAAERARTGDRWALSALEIEARLRTYFTRPVVAGWEVYAWAVDRFIDASNVSSEAALQDAVQRPVRLDPGVADAAAQLIVYAENAEGDAPAFEPASGTSNSAVANFAALRKLLGGDVARYEAAPLVLSTWTALEKSLLGFEQAVADEVLRSHAAGFSTTARDLMHDLMP